MACSEGGRSTAGGSRFGEWALLYVQCMAREAEAEKIAATKAFVPVKPTPVVRSELIADFSPSSASPFSVEMNTTQIIALVAGLSLFAGFLTFLVARKRKH